MGETNLPESAVLIDAAREAMRQVPEDVPADPERTTELRRRVADKALDQWKPEIDRLTDLAGAAEFLGLAYNTVKRKQTRKRADNTPEWPEADQTFGRQPKERQRGRHGGWTPTWKYRTIVIHQAEAPGRGHPRAALGRTNADKRKHGGA